MAERINFDNAWFAAESGSESLLAREMAPSSDWTAMRGTDHFVQFYETDEFLAASVAEYVFHGLKTAETCIVIATAEHLASIESIRAKFSLRAVEPFVDEDRYIRLDARETLNQFMVDGKPDAVLFEETIGSVVRKACSRGRMRAFGEMVALLVADGNPEAAIALERLWNGLRERYTFSLYCAYSADEMAAKGHGFMPEICGNHSRVIPSESYVSLTTAEERLRAVAYLQHRAKQLEAELAVLQYRISRKTADVIA